MDIRSEARTFGRVLSLDAMRGAAALVVVIYHALGVAPLTAAGGWEYWLPKLTAYLVHFGYAGVYLFFVISGFCIHLHWGRARAVGVEDPVVNFLPFWKRRVRRLYPPYLAALVLYLVHTAYVSDVKVTGFYLWDVLLHLLMLHNLDPRTCYTINGAFWTLAIEEQLYLAYFLLLFLRRRYGWARTLMVCAASRVAWLVLGRAVSYFAGIEIPVSEAAATSWLTWALGALSVEAALGVVVLPRWCYQMRAAVAALLVAMGLALALPHAEWNVWLHDAGWLVMHPAWGVGFFVLVNIAVRKEQGWRRALARTPRAVKLLAPVGLISYSLYLTHLVVLMKWYWFGFLRLHILTITLLVMTPLCLLFAWLFYRLFELPFMTRPAVAALHPTHSGAASGQVEPSSIN
jgi:peptidoglycan/LPS O-acetylase OafA/YrhL